MQSKDSKQNNTLSHLFSKYLRLQQYLFGVLLKLGGNNFSRYIITNTYQHKQEL